MQKAMWYIWISHEYINKFKKHKNTNSIIPV